jgi:catalase
MHQSAVHGGAAPYKPNTLDGGCPFTAGAGDHPFVDVPAPVAAGVKERAHPASFDDHFSQAAMFYRSLTPVEQDHVAAAYTFELSKCFDTTIRERQLQALANIDEGLCRTVAQGLALPVPAPTVEHGELVTSAALSQVGGSWPVAGRQLGIVVGDGVDEAAVTTVADAAREAGVVPLVVGPHGGTIGGLTVHRTYAAVSSTELDAVVLVGELPPAPDALVSLGAEAGVPGDGTDPRVVKLVGEAWRHSKALGSVGGDAALTGGGARTGGPGVVGGSADDVAPALLELLAAHRAWGRFPTRRDR